MLLFSNHLFGLTANALQMGLAVYSALMIVMMGNNGGVHRKDLTVTQAESAIYVNNVTTNVLSFS
jgi:hypothetical protein